MIRPPEGWQDRVETITLPGPDDFKMAMSRVAIAEAAVLRIEDKIKIMAPTDPDWEAEYDFAAEAYELVIDLERAREEREDARQKAKQILIQWHDYDRKAATS